MVVEMLLKFGAKVNPGEGVSERLVHSPAQSLNSLSSITQLLVSALTHSTSDAGSQYRCGRVGRGIQPPSTPHGPTINTQTKKGI